HRRRDLAERQRVEQHLHVLEAVDGDADLADLAARERMIRVAPHLRRQIERDRQPALPLLQQVAVAPVRLRPGAEARVLPHRPEAAAVHRPLHAARERRLAGPPEIALRVEPDPRQRLVRVELVDLDVRLGPAAHIFISGIAPLTMRRGSASFWISSTEASGARSLSTSPPAVTSMTARSVMISCTQRLPVSGSS